jgi:hypothetical protein
VAEDVVREEIPEIMREESSQAVSAPPAKPILEFDWQSDLTQIETDRAKLKAAHAKVQDAESAAPPRKRERPPSPPVSDEPLVQVETGKPKPEAERAPVNDNSDREAVARVATN